MSTHRASTPIELAFAVMFAIPPNLARLLARMNAGETVNALRVNVWTLRRALEPESIDTVPGGYRLTDVGQAECNRAVGEFLNWVNGRYAA